MKQLMYMILSIIVLSGCVLSEEELIETMVSNSSYEEGCYKVYVVFESEEQAFSGKFNIELSKESEHRMLYGPLHTWDRGQWNYTKAFNIDEYPTFLIVDHAGLVLQTTSLQAVDEFLTSQLSVCE